jgi:hypothetical protein
MLALASVRGLFFKEGSKKKEAKGTKGKKGKKRKIGNKEVDSSRLRAGRQRLPRDCTM